MRKYKVQEKLIATNEKIWMGIDAHKKTLHFAIRNSDGVIYEGSVPNAYNHVRGIVGRMPGCEITAVYESGPTGYKLLHWLQELGCKAFITPASKVLEEKDGKRIKTDGRDSKQLAKLLHADLLTEVHDLGEQGYCRRELTRTRQQLVEHRSGICLQIKSKLTYHHIETPKSLKTSWSKKYLHWLESDPSGDRTVDLVLKSLVRIYQELSKEIDRLQKEIKALTEQEEFAEQVGLLTSIPGVGILTAMTVLLELGDIGRFNTAEEFSSFLGLVPGEWSSGEKQRKGSRVRWGNRRARTALVEASWRLIGKDPEMRKVYEGIKYRRGSGRAIVAVARRLGLAMRGMLREGKAYDYGTAKKKLEGKKD